MWNALRQGYGASRSALGLRGPPHRLPAAGVASVQGLAIGRCPTSASPWLGASRRWASSQGMVKMWNDDKGFGFIAPADGGEDVFVHRTSLAQGTELYRGASVKYEAIWDDRKQKNRADNVTLDGDDSGGAHQETTEERGPPPEKKWEERGPSARSRPSQPSVPQGPARSHHIVGSFEDWKPHREPMSAAESGDGRLRHQLKVRGNAPEAPKGRGVRREEFQILGDSSWDRRFYPGGGDKEDVVVLHPGAPPSPVANDFGKGHGRNWAVEGRSGEAFEITFDPEAKTVACEFVGGS